MKNTVKETINTRISILQSLQNSVLQDRDNILSYGYSKVGYQNKMLN